MTSKAVWRTMKSAPKNGARVWLELTDGRVALGRWKPNPPKSYKPGHWATDLGTASSQSELGEPVAWQAALVPKRHGRLVVELVR